MTVYTYARERKGRFFRNHAINQVMMLSSLIQPSLYPYWAVSQCMIVILKGTKKKKEKHINMVFQTPLLDPQSIVDSVNADVAP
ncbi:hypothetical protein MTR_7g088610 [Medicago truncatula]|uniref:Uncharacterized protein n=1 Tax=Medicago truncatula TaxID=3880 RepID=G7L4T2_MEDTR|nr:hypothetical protein MTR_7g088610 [Medicago truncatula]